MDEEIIKEKGNGGIKQEEREFSVFETFSSKCAPIESSVFCRQAHKCCHDDGADISII